MVQSVIGHSPAELMFGRKLKLSLDLLHPDLNRKVQAKMIRKNSCHDRGTKLRKFNIGNNVYLKNFLRGDQWLPEVMSSKRPGIIRSYVD